MKKIEVKSDVSVTNCGNLFLFVLLTEAAVAWVHDNVSIEGYQWTSKSSFAVDYRFAGDLVEGMQGHGLVME